MLSRPVLFTAVVFLFGVSVTGQVVYPCNEYGLDDVVFLNHATSCSKYVICIAGQAAIRDCAPGLRFDIEEETCRVDANCHVEDKQCPLFDDPNALVFHPHPDFCDQFSMCAGGELRNRTCAPGLHWDWEKEWCNFPDEANCPVRVDCPVQGIVYLPHPANCRKYFICLNGHLQLAACSDGLIFDVNRSACFFEDQSVCVLDFVTPPHFVCTDVPDYTMIVDPDDCTKFYTCLQGDIMYRHQCPEGKIFIENECVQGIIEDCD